VPDRTQISTTLSLGVIPEVKVITAHLERIISNVQSHRCDTAIIAANARNNCIDRALRSPDHQTIWKESCIDVRK
jgi:hypothetical protein